MIETLVYEVVLPIGQLALMEPLEKLFPVVLHYHFTGCEYRLLVVMDKGQYYTEQRNFLKENALTYIDIATQRERWAQDFFMGVDLEGLPIKYISLYNAPNNPAAHMLVLSNGVRASSFVLPAFWSPRYATVLVNDKQ